MNGYTEEEKIRIWGSIEQYNIDQAEQYLKETDYITNKIAEYTYIGKEIKEDYSEVIKKREEARQIIRDNR